jgi:glycosyltransferase involved in cell wall biosynthesis
MSVPPITVLMPVYNAEKYLREAMDSILTQTFMDFEFLIVNDGSTDGTEEIIQSYNDSRIHLITQPNGGVSAALNTGLAAAKGKYIARFDADDISMPDRLERQYRFITTHPGYVMVGSDAEYVDKNGTYVFTFSSPGHTDEEIRNCIYDKNPFIHSAVLYAKDAVLSCGGYDKGAHIFEDHLLWVRLIRVGRVFNETATLVKVRLNPESVTTDERVWGSRFMALRKKILLSGQAVTEEEDRELLAIIRKHGTGKRKDVGYYLFIAKKYLWNNYQPRLARRHLMKAIASDPSELQEYLLLAVSFLPEAFIRRLYHSVK